ncbi:MAG: flagellar basal body P-ring formation chaperone FlgA [bacterium]
MLTLSDKIAWAITGYSLIMGIATVNGSLYAPQKVDFKKIETAIQNHVHRNLKLDDAEWLIEFPDINIKLRNGTTESDVQVLPTKGKLRKGRQFLKCGLFEAGRLIEKFSIPINIRTFQNVVVNKAPLRRHSVLGKAHVTIEKRETTNIHHNIYLATQHVLGLRTTRFLQEGEIITDNLLEHLPTISKGSEVKIHFLKNSLEIVLPGIVREDGQTGETVRVKCLQTNKTFKAQVMDGATVIVKLL